MTGRRWNPVLRALALALLTLGIPTMGQAQQPDASVEERLSRVRSTLESLRSAYLQPIELRRAYDLASRMTEARMRYLYGDYDGASILFLDIAETRSFEQQPGYWDSVHLLGESLMARRNYGLARTYFLRSLEHGNTEQGIQAAQRLLEIAFVLRDFRGLDDMYGVLERRSGGRTSPELSYIRGKSLYFQQRYDQAVQAFSLIPDDAEIRVLGQYFEAVALVRLGRFDEAITQFEQVIARTEGAGSSTEAFAVRELAHLAVARVLYEQGRWDEAESAYLRVSGTSQRYDAALYELAWTRVQQGELDPAIRQLEILEIVGRNHRLLPEAGLLRGDLLLRDGEYEAANTQFDRVADTYQPVEQELRGILAAGDSPESYYRRFMDPDRGEMRIPGIVRPWFDADDGARRSTDVVRDLQSAEHDLKDCELILAELDAALANPIVLFGRWREGWGNAVRAEVLLLDTWEDLVESAYRQTEAGLTPARRQEYDTLRRGRMDLGAQYRARPRSFDEMNADANERTRAVSEQRLELLRAQQVLAESIEQIESVRTLLARSNRSAAERAEFEARIAAAEGDLLRQRDQADALQRQYQAAVAGIGVGDRQSEEDAALRRAYREALRAELAWLRTHGNASSAAYARHESDLESMSEQLDAFFAELGAWVAEQTSGLRAEVEAERARVARLVEQTERQEQASIPVLGALTRASLASVRDRFERLTLRASLGGIDVAWRDKEQASSERQSLLREQVRALRALEMDFAEIREDP